MEPAMNRLPEALQDHPAISAHRHEGWQITFGGPNDEPYCGACGHYPPGRVVDAIGPFRIKEYDTVLQPGTADPYCVVWNVDVEPARRYSGIVTLAEARFVAVKELERFWDI